MLRSFGRKLIAAVVIAAGCRDMDMNLFPPPAEAAGTGAESGTPNETPMGDAGDRPMGGSSGHSGGSGASGGGGGTAAGVGGSCVPGSNCPPPCQPGTPGCPECYSRSDCSSNDLLPYCANGHCVQCLPGCEPGQCGCDANEVCVDDEFECVRICGSDSDCATVDDNLPWCDRRFNICVQCRSEQDCETQATKKQCFSGSCVECVSNKHCRPEAPNCNLYEGTCVECYSDQHCRPDAPKCNLYEGTCVECLSNFDCPDDRLCNRDSRCVSTPPPQP